MKSKTKFLTHAAIIAALYVLLTLLSQLFGLASGAIQLRISEALCILPYFTPAAIPGLAVGCTVANIVTGCAPWDVVFGSIATLLGALGTYALRRCGKFLLPLPAVLSNALIIPFVLMNVYAAPEGWAYLTLTVGAGEILSCYIFGMILFGVLNKHKNKIF